MVSTTEQQVIERLQNEKEDLKQRLENMEGICNDLREGLKTVVSMNEENIRLRLEEQLRREETEAKFADAVNTVANMKNWLQWIGHRAFLHWFGGAFDPVHMADLLEMSRMALRGDDVQDFEEAMERSQRWAEETLREWRDLSDDSDDENNSADADEVQTASSEELPVTNPE